MADKGFLAGNMKFGTSDEPPEMSEGPLLPLRVVVLTALVPNDEANAGAGAPEAPLRVEGTDIAQVFAKIRPRISIEIPSVLDQGRKTKIEIAPTSLRSFRPDGLVQEVPLVRSLLDGKLILDRLRAGEINDEQAWSQLDRLWSGAPLAAEVLGRSPRTAAAAPAEPTRAAPAAKPAGDSAIDSILDLVDVPGGSSSGPAEEESPRNDNRIAKIISDVATGGRRTSGRALTGIPRVEEALGLQIGAILQHPEVRRLERAYRGVAFLLERSQRIPGVFFDVVAIPSEGAAVGLAKILKRTSDAPASVAIVDVDIDGTARAFTELEAIAEVAESFVVPVLVNGTEGLLGVGDLSRVDKLDSKMNLFTAPHRAPWRATANKQSLRWVAIAVNGILGRLPYDKQSSRVREAVIAELPSDHEANVWIGPAYALASVIVQSFKDTGWPARITGAKNGIVENLPVREIDDDGATVAIPTQAFISTESQRELSRVGVLALASAPNSDAAYVHVAPTAYVQPDKKVYDGASSGPEDRPPPISLVDQLFVARLVQFARALCSKIPPDSDPKEIQPVLHAALWALFDKAPPSGPELSVDVGRDADGLVAKFNIRARRYLGVSLDEFGFDMPIG